MELIDISFKIALVLHDICRKYMLLMFFIFILPLLFENKHAQLHSRCERRILKRYGNY